MVPDIETDGGTTEMSRDENIEMPRNAVKNGVLDAIGTVALLGFSLLALFIGIRGFFIDSSMAISGGFVIASCLLAAAAFNLIPPFRD
ncbi:hypothetical protein C488_14397 [Natrinema pellirubrum DSM 15624]|uniref:Uncharacterized protein n=1 Tax=Natrinema pellirubrum (strain DSM 15624 / CIP 106293 / JCM 10476 / NCIMB 786 / 157) TaxID=797303 RepID=L0JJF9_NATP1|nr:hypothetical protein [Natrinema pellirubrum]AGB31670.1 hypothetical protein Natpe_1782 [Natrinema pellirubrum DSM 15624]ELY73038.1 hypothetical protein C488_14397 [Natrinema pellirubrum DSM 15624]